MIDEIKKSLDIFNNERKSYVRDMKKNIYTGNNC